MVETLQHLAELTVQFLKVLLFFAAIVAPAAWVCLRRLPDRSIVGRLAIGVTLGFSLFVVEAWYVGLWSLDWLIGLWVAHYALATWLGRRPTNNVANANGVESISDDRRKTRYWPILLPLVAAIVLQLYALQFSQLPPGVDSSFHCVVARRQLDAGRATMDLWPLEELKLNYPIGSHLWVAVAARWTGLEIHEVFRHSFALALCGAALCVGAWTEKMFGLAGPAAAGAFAFIFLSYEASFFPYTWGGLPSALAMWQGLGAWYCLFHVSGRSGLAAGSLLFAGVAMTHHHTMVALLGGTVVLASLGFAFIRLHRPGFTRILFAVLGAAVVAGVYLIPLASRAGELGETGTLTYQEPFAWPWEQLWHWGPGLLVTICIGLMIRVLSATRESRWFLLGIAALWLVGFAILDYGGREFSRWYHGKPATPFTPSRFLFDVQFVAAIFAGGGLWQLWQWLRRPAFQFALMAGFACLGVWRTESRWNAIPSDMLLPVGTWARTHLPKDALVTGLPNHWLTYVCGRESTSMFIPISEPGPARRRAIKEVLQQMPHRFSAEQWRSQLGKPIYVIGSARDESWGGPLFVAGPLAIYHPN
jgi:hypothetical protein